MSKEEGLNYFSFAALNFCLILEGSVNPELHPSGQKKSVECNFSKGFFINSDSMQAAWYATAFCSNTLKVLLKSWEISKHAYNQLNLYNE